MKHDLKALLTEAGKKMKMKPQHVAADFEHLSQSLCRHHVHLSSSSLKKMWEIATGKRKLSPEALDRLALFAGFQDWTDLNDALHGDADASLNYDDKALTTDTHHAKA
jgi:hypothetical protein